MGENKEKREEVGGGGDMWLTQNVLETCTLREKSENVGAVYEQYSRSACTMHTYECGHICSHRKR